MHSVEDEEDERQSAARVGENTNAETCTTVLAAPATRPMPATTLLTSIDDQRWQNNGHCFFDFEEKSTQAVYNVYSTHSLAR